MADKKDKKQSKQTLTRGNRQAMDARLKEIMASMPTRDRRK